MLIHGKLILTSNGFLLDEVRSLLQKSLRRKEKAFAQKATKELLGYGKDQLPWKSIVTFLFEDHCLNSEQILLKMKHFHGLKDKYACVELLLAHCGTCRIAACLPVIAMDPEYDPVDWDSELPVDDELCGLVSQQSSRIDFDRLLQHLKNAWVERHVSRIISYIKMATMVCDHDDRTVTKKGMKYCFFSEAVKPKHVGAVVLTLLGKTSKTLKNESMEAYARCCCYFALIPDVPVRLIISAAATQYIHSDLVKRQPKELPVQKTDWQPIRKLNQIPDWAVDKHTFRGKYGKGTTHLLKKPDAKRFNESELQEFHGPRPKQDIVHFFSEGTLCAQQITDTNPYWDRCKQLYLERPKKLQKTIRMTAVYYTEQLRKFPLIRGVGMEKKGTPDETNDKSKGQKRKKEEVDEGAGNSPSRSLRKKMKVEKPEKESTKSESTCQATAEDAITITEIHSDDEPCLHGPLLQLPTGSAKMYTRVDLENKAVWKGPYSEDRIRLVMFLHRVLKEVFADQHTLPVRRKGSYVKFPLLHSKDADMKVTSRDFYDCIGKQHVTEGHFVERENLGIIQLHNIHPSKIGSLPATFWCHFIFRFLLNVGDSGLYNSITDSSFSFLFGIDMEEVRKNVAGSDLLNLMFVKLPKKKLCSEIKLVLKRLKPDIMRMLSATYDLNKLVALSRFYQIKFEKNLFDTKLDKVKNAVDKM